MIEKLLFALLPPIATAIVSWGTMAAIGAANAAYYTLVIATVYYQLFTVPTRSSFCTSAGRGKKGGESGDTGEMYVLGPTERMIQTLLYMCKWKPSGIGGGGGGGGGIGIGIGIASFPFKSQTTIAPVVHLLCLVPASSALFYFAIYFGKFSTSSFASLLQSSEFAALGILASVPAYVVCMSYGRGSLEFLAMGKATTKAIAMTGALVALAVMILAVESR